MEDDESSTYDNNCYCSFRGFLVYPNGKYLIVPQTLTIIATTLSICAFLNCEFVHLYTKPCDEWICYDDRTGIGFVWHEEYPAVFGEGMEGYSNCVGWTNDDERIYLDTWYQVGFSLSMAAAALGFVTCVLILASACMVFGRKIFVALSLLKFLCAVMEGLSLLVFMSDICNYDGGNVAFYGCTFGRGGRIAVVAAIFWFTSSIACFIEGTPLAASMLPK